MFQARQGDIFFKSVRKKPSEANKAYNSPVLAYGEITGHAHKICEPAFSDLESYVDEEGDIYVLSHDKEIKVGHDEHNQIVCPPNTWICVSRQQEYDPLNAERTRKVAD